MRAVRCLLALLALAGVAAFGGAEKQEVTREVKAVVEKVRDAFDEAANAQGMNRMKGASRFEPVDVRAQKLRPGICALQNRGLSSSAASLPHHLPSHKSRPLLRLTTLPLLPQVMTQVVAGVNYFVKVKVGEGDEYAFLRIYDRFGDVQLTSFQLGKTASDPIAYFE